MSDDAQKVIAEDRLQGGNMNSEMKLATLLSVIDSGFDIQIRSLAKRMTDKRGIRDWHVRFVWSAEGDINEECGWEGFETAEECVADMINKLAGR